MISKWTTILLLSTVINGVLADGYDTYTPYTYPDSLKDFKQCRQYPLKTIDPSLACDPNHILNDIDSKEGIISHDMYASSESSWHRPSKLLA
jgi:hypothetical protein